MSQHDEFILQQNIQKKKDEQPDGGDTDPKSSSYDASKITEAERVKLGQLKEQMAEQEGKWKEEYDALMDENAKLKKQGGDALEVAKWQERYEAAVKEKDEAMANIEMAMAKLIEVQQMESANLKEQQLKAVSTTNNEKESNEATLKEKDQEIEALNSNEMHDVGDAEMAAVPPCSDDPIGKDSDPYEDNEDVDVESGSKKEDRNYNDNALTKRKGGNDINEAKLNLQQKNRRRCIIIGGLVCIVIVIIAIAVPIAVVGGRKAEPNVFIGESNSICGRSIPIDLNDTSTWPTPSTPTLFQADYALNSVTIIKNEDHFGTIGSQLNAFFRAFDYSHDTRLPLYITQDNYFFQTGFFKLFMGGYTQDEEFWGILEGILGAKIVQNENVLLRQGKLTLNHKGPEELSEYIGKELVATQIRNHRDTIMRKLFRYPTQTGGEDDVCSLIQSEGPSKKYTVIHLSDKKTNSLLSKLNRMTGIDHSAAVEMEPEYVKAFLTPLEMLNNDIYPIATSEHDAEDTTVAERIQALLDDYVLGDLIKLPKESRHLGSVLYFAVLADAYIGNPVDHNSMWIARMRCALGLCSNTFVLTKKKLIDWTPKWASYVNNETYLELYDREMLGLWSG